MICLLIKAKEHKKKVTPKEFQSNLDLLKANKKKEHGGQSYIDKED